MGAGRRSGQPFGPGPAAWPCTLFGRLRSLAGGPSLAGRRLGPLVPPALHVRPRGCHGGMSGQGGQGGPRGAMRRPDTRRHRWAGVAIAAPVCEPRAADNLNITAQIRGPKGREETMGKRFGTPHFASRHDRGCRRLRGGDAAHPLGDRPGQTAQSWPDAALLGDLRQTRRKHHLRHRNADRRKGRQARRPRDPNHQARR